MEQEDKKKEEIPAIKNYSQEDMIKSIVIIKNIMVFYLVVTLISAAIGIIAIINS